MLKRIRAFVCLLVACLFYPQLALREAAGQKPAQRPQQTRTQTQTRALAAPRPVPEETLLRILRAEDERRWESSDIGPLLFDKDARVRRRAALAAGRIGDERAVAALVALLQSDREQGVRSMAAFALGETESTAGAEALISALRRENETSEVRARAVEALGKIAAALPESDAGRARALGEVILGVLTTEARRAPSPNREVSLSGLTAALRARPANAGPVLALFLSQTDARLRADAANALARLRSKDVTDKLRALLKDTDPVVRANAARALGVAEERGALDALVERSIVDADERVRVSSIRALGSLKDARAAAQLLDRANKLFSFYRASRNGSPAINHPSQTNELLEIATVLGRLLAGTGNADALTFLRDFRTAEEMTDPEIEIALARISPALYLREKPFDKSFETAATRALLFKDWRAAASLSQGLGEINGMTAETAGNGIISLQADAQMILRALIEDRNLPALALPDALRAFAAIKSGDPDELLRKQLKAPDVIVRATAAELLGELAPSETNARSLSEALPLAMRDELNDAALAILDALAKQKTDLANNAIKTALDSADHLVRRRAVSLLKANGAGDFSARIGNVTTRNTNADYLRGLARAGKQVRAVVNTDKGAFTLELLAEDAPLTVDNFVQLARRGYFNNITFHRVVPNFVVQGGDPRGDGNGGPGYQIRCEINEVPYDRGAVGMALSGKDTGGSQWFVTHSPQPHLNGGYTVFGRVVAGMDVLDQIARGDRIRSISITETARGASKPEGKPASRKEATREKTEKSSTGTATKKRT